MITLHWYVEQEEPDLWDLVPDIRIGFYNNRLMQTMYHPLHHPDNKPWSQVESLWSYFIGMTKNHGRYADEYDLSDVRYQMERI